MPPSPETDSDKLQAICTKMPISPFTTSFDYEVQVYREMRKAYLEAEKQKKQQSRSSSTSSSACERLVSKPSNDTDVELAGRKLVAKLLGSRRTRSEDEGVSLLAESVTVKT